MASLSTKNTPIHINEHITHVTGHIISFVLAIMAVRVAVVKVHTMRIEYGGSTSRVVKVYQLR